VAVPAARLREWLGEASVLARGEMAEVVPHEIEKKLSEASRKLLRMVDKNRIKALDAAGECAFNRVLIHYGALVINRDRLMRSMDGDFEQGLIARDELELAKSRLFSNMLATRRKLVETLERECMA